MLSLAHKQPSTNTTLAVSSDAVEHVSTQSTPPVQDATFLREAALKSRRARKQAALNQSRQESRVLGAQGGPVEDEDTHMDDTTTRTKADAEDGEILEVGQASGSNDSGTNAREKTPQPSPGTSNKRAASFIENSGERRYVRPGLKMTARDLDEAKCLILDLLGLGVKPEYLVDCGVSPQCLAVCFYEMNLRFPLNLDRRQIDLPPIYDLDKHMRDSQRREQIIRQRDRTKAASMHPSVVATTTSVAQPVSNDVTTDSSKLASERSLEETPQATSGSTSPAPTSNDDQSVDGANVQSHSSGSPTSSGSTPTMDSSAAEDQKRMELLARKAAMESINRKRAAKHNAQPTRLEIQDVESAVDALLASVRMDSASSGQSQDRFSEGGDNASSGSGELLPDYDSDAMVEDELDARSSSLSDPGADDKTMEPTLMFGHQRNLSPEYLAQDGSAPSSSPRLAASRVRFDASARSSSLPLQPALVAVPVVARRSRPIASDFIDQAPPRPASAFQSEPDRTAPLKRKRSFVDPAVWPKRLVIDLDSSDEENEGEDEDETNARSSTSGNKATSERPLSRSTTHDERAAQMLLEKELQIKAMMQRIKMRELQKKKSASGTATPASSLALEDTRSQVPSTVITPASASTEHATPLLTPSSEMLVELINTDDTEKSSPPLEDSLGTTAPKVDEGKSKATEPEKGNTQGTSDNVNSSLRLIYAIELAVDAPIVARTVDQPKTQSQHLANIDSDAAVPTHFKAYASPLVGFTSPSLQRSEPTDFQLSTMYWVSSEAGQNQDVNRQLCQYEFPNGICKDQGCKDIHKRDFGASDDQIWKTATSMFPNAGPRGLKDIVARVRQSVQAQN